MSEQPKPSTELVAVPPKAGGMVKAIVPQNMEELKYVANLVIGGGIAPDSYGGSAQKIALGIMKAAEVGLPPLTGLQWIAIINGRPTIYGDGTIALVQSRGVLEKMEVEEIGDPPGETDEPNTFADNYGIRVSLWRKGQGAAYVGQFTVGDAKRAKLWGNPKRQPWMLYPKRMLKWRALGFAIRDGFADCLAGMMIAEEVEDIPAPAETPSTDFLEDLPSETVEELGQGDPEDGEPTVPAPQPEPPPQPGPPAEAEPEPAEAAVPKENFPPVR